MLILQEIIKNIIVIITTGLLVFQSDPTSPIVDISDYKQTEAITFTELCDPVFVAYDKTLDEVVEEKQEEIDKEKAEALEAQRIEQEKLEQEKLEQERLEQERIAQEQAQQATFNEVQPQESSQPQQSQARSNTITYDQYIALNGSAYRFESLALNTQVAQNFIDSNPDSFGLWNDVTYATTFDILFAHDYGAGELVYNASVGDTITLHYRNGSTETYRVVNKTIQSINSYYDSNSSLWQTVGTDFDLMIKTCYEVNVTDIMITLVKV